MLPGPTLRTCLGLGQSIEINIVDSNIIFYISIIIILCGGLILSGGLGVKTSVSSHHFIL